MPSIRLLQTQQQGIEVLPVVSDHAEYVILSLTAEKQLSWTNLTPGARQEIALETVKGNQIPNDQSGEIFNYDRAKFEDLTDKFGNHVDKRGKPTPLYNCHGMTFAARRTWVYHTNAVRKILDDDNYCEVEMENVLPGDIIIYFSEDDIDHSGVVVRRSSEDELLNVPVICSKWGKYSEVIHRANNCPYDFSNTKYYRVDL